MNDSELIGPRKGGILLLLGLIAWFALSGYGVGRAEGGPAPGTTYTTPSGAKVTIQPEGTVCTAPDGHRV